MALNPSQRTEPLNSPNQRANELNDPQFENQQGYFPYDLTHQEFLTPRFGEITPSMHLDTVPGDRIVFRDNHKTVLNQINGNLLSTMNQYSDTYFVSLRCLFPKNYEKLIPNPTKGSDLPNSALPQIPFFLLLQDYLFGSSDYILTDLVYDIDTQLSSIMDFSVDMSDSPLALQREQFAFGRMVLLATILSRGQLLDYLGFAIDENPSLNSSSKSLLQEKIDNFLRAYYTNLIGGSSLMGVPLELTSNKFIIPSDNYINTPTLSDVRDAISRILESGKLPFTDESPDPDVHATYVELFEALYNIVNTFDPADYTIEAVDSSSDPFASGACINIAKPLAYQLIVAQYFSRDSVDNIFNADLWMQNFRSVLFPASEYVTLSGFGYSSEPTFKYNGVSTEYDLISYGSIYSSLLNNRVTSGQANRMYVAFTLLFLMRNSLRYGDYFSTGRPRMLAVGQLEIPVSANSVSPIDVTRNLLMQRYLNAANYIGSGFLQYFSSIYGVKPSDTGVIPRYISHRKIELQNQLTNNTSDEQGKQTTNLVGYSDFTAADVFIDDFGVVLSLVSYDVLPVYTQGVDSSFHFADRFDYFNPMLQGVGDQPIRKFELYGNPVFYNQTFGYTMRNAEYKFKISKAHGAFVNSLPGWMFQYPLFRDYSSFANLTINPDFIRDRPVYLDRTIPASTGCSPAEYFHFIVATTNEVKTARKIQAQPGILF